MSRAVTKIRPDSFCSSAGSESDHLALEFRSLLRLRPLLKKERDETVVLHESFRDNDVPRIVLNPSPVTHGEVTASSQLVLETLSPEAVQREAEYEFDSLFNTDASQDKLYYSVGLPMSLEAMELLKTGEGRKKTHLIVSMGVVNSGKTFTTWGSLPIKRKAPTDGLVPRLIDSLFSQSKHHVTKKSTQFGVSVSILQINQYKQTHKTKDNVQIFDLQQPIVASSTFKFSPVKTTNAVRSLVANFERHSSTTASTHVPTVKQQKAAQNDPVMVEQDPITMDFRVVNATPKTYSSVEDARSAVSIALANSQKLSSKKKLSHVLVQIQPVLIQDDRIVQRGGIIAILDMAGIALSDKYSRTPAQQRSKDSTMSRCNAHGAVLHCLKNLKYNQIVLANRAKQAEQTGQLKKVPYMQHKVTMMLQPLLSPHQADSACITILQTAHIGHADYDAKKSLLQELASLTLHKAPKLLEVQSDPTVHADKSLDSKSSNESSDHRKHAIIDHRECIQRDNKRQDVVKVEKPSTPHQVQVVKANAINYTQKQDNAKVGGDLTKFSGKHATNERVVYHNLATSEVDNGKLVAAVSDVPKVILPRDFTPNGPLIQTSSSMTYSDSSVNENEYVVPMPPPIAPSYMSPSATLPTISMSRHIPNLPTAPMWDDSRHVPSLSTFYTSQLHLGAQNEETYPSSHAHSESKRRLVQEEKLDAEVFTNENERVLVERNDSYNVDGRVHKSCLHTTLSSDKRKGVTDNDRILGLERENESLRDNLQLAKEENVRLRDEIKHLRGSVSASLHTKSSYYKSEGKVQSHSTQLLSSPGPKVYEDFMSNPLFQHISMLNQAKH